LNRIYIARKYVGIEGISSRHYYEERVFSSYELAYEFIKLISEEEHDCFLSEIVSYPLNNTSFCDEQEIYTFDRKGQLLITDTLNRYDNYYVFEEDIDRKIYPKHEQASYSGKYKIGDIVFIRAYPWNDVSPTHKDTIGVVSAIPDSLDKWIANGYEMYTWDNAYVVDCIRDGYLGHWHVEEKGITPFNDKLPDNLEFLKILSNHYRTESSLPDNIINDVISGKLFIEKVTHFDFENFSTVR